MAPTPEPKSLIRAILGVLALGSSVIVIPIGFVLLVVDSGADARTQALIRPLSVLMAGGALLAFGIATLIWEMSVRYGVRR